MTAGTIAKLALVSAIGGPSLGSLLLSTAILLDRVSGYWSPSSPGMERVPAGWTILAFLYYALFFAAPGAAAFGAVGSWLLIRRNPIVIVGALTGLLLGVAIAGIVTRRFPEHP